MNRKKVLMLWIPLAATSLLVGAYATYASALVGVSGLGGAAQSDSEKDEPQFEVGDYAVLDEPGGHTILSFVRMRGGAKIMLLPKTARDFRYWQQLRNMPAAKKGQAAHLAMRATKPNGNRFEPVARGLLCKVVAVESEASDRYRIRIVDAPPPANEVGKEGVTNAYRLTPHESPYANEDL